MFYPHLFFALYNYISRINKMGNVDMTKDETFMKCYNQHAFQFIKQKPLFYAQEITFPLSTKGAYIVDATGRRVKLAGGNWSGGHLCRQCVDGLECRPLREIAQDIKYKFHFNCIRLTYSLQLFFDDKKIKQKYLKANPELIGKTAMQIFDYTIQVLTDVGLMVILNNHTSTSMWCCTNDDGDGLWWSYQYPQNMFFQCAEEFARRYKDNPLVVGMDLRNQLRKANGIEATWGDKNPLTDWYRAAKKCGEKVLAIAPHWLIIVAGLSFQLDFTGVQTQPLQYSVPNKLVYSGHFYSFSWPPSMATFSYDSFRKKMFNSQTFVRGYGIPYVLGQFGNNKRDGPWKYLIKYLKETDIDWIYWPIDGFKCDPDDPDQDQTYGIFDHQFRKIRNPEIFNDLRTIGAPKNIEREKKRNNIFREGKHGMVDLLKSQVPVVKPPRIEIKEKKEEQHAHSAILLSQKKQEEIESPQLRNVSSQNAQIRIEDIIDTVQKSTFHREVVQKQEESLSPKKVEEQKPVMSGQQQKRKKIFEE